MSDRARAILKRIYLSGRLGFLFVHSLRWFVDFIRYRLVSDRRYVERRFLVEQGYPLDLANPRSLNEKIQWLKLYHRIPLHTQSADKYAAREYLANKVGEHFLVPLFQVTEDPDKLDPAALPDEPMIIKPNNGCGGNFVVRDKARMDWERVRGCCRVWLHDNLYVRGKEWQYKDIRPKILVEKLLLTREGRIPNDYKIHCFNGRAEFVYVSIDREGANKRNIYARDWTPLSFTWAARHKELSKLRGPEIPPPLCYAKMLEIAELVAQDFVYVRVDMYDVDGAPYIGELTLHQGAGFDVITPREWDYRLGDMLDLGSLRGGAPT